MCIKDIKNYLSTKIGSKIIVVYHCGRNKCERYDGILLRVYGNIFTLRLVNNEIKSFNYFDILTKTIQIYI